MYTLPTMQCLRCKHKWIPRKESITVCPKCKSPYWNIPKGGNGENEAQNRRTDNGAIQEDAATGEPASTDMEPGSGTVRDRKEFSTADGKEGEGDTD